MQEQEFPWSRTKETDVFIPWRSLVTRLGRRVLARTTKIQGVRRAMKVGVVAGCPRFFLLRLRAERSRGGRMSRLDLLSLCQIS